jgi:hypothetical protein
MLDHELDYSLSVLVEMMLVIEDPVLGPRVARRPEDMSGFHVHETHGEPDDGVLAKVPLVAELAYRALEHGVDFKSTSQGL